MTASALQSRVQPASRPRTTARTARNAAHSRRKRTVSLRYRSIVRIVGWLGAATILVVGYLWLMANVTKMNYEYAKATQERTQLLERTGRLDDQIAQLESRERLAAVAAQLGMSESAHFSVATLAASGSRADARVSRRALRGVALLPAITDWLR
jgi:cell division protein FtsL